MTNIPDQGNDGFVVLPNQNPNPQIPNGGLPPGSITSGGTSPVGNPAVNLSALPVTGGLLGISTALLVVGYDFVANNNLVYLIDPTNFNCEEDVEYDFKIEEAQIGNQLTIHRILIRYRNLGPCTIKVAIVSDEFSFLTPKNSTTIVLGDSTASGRIKTAKADLKVTTEAPQVKIFRSAFAGPMAITKLQVVASYGDGDII